MKAVIDELMGLLRMAQYDSNDPLMGFFFLVDTDNNVLCCCK
jgi:hypothetical protein